MQDKIESAGGRDGEHWLIPLLRDTWEGASAQNIVAKLSRDWRMSFRDRTCLGGCTNLPIVLAEEVRYLPRSSSPERTPS